MNKTKLHLGDTVTVITGRDKKKSGKILKIDQQKNKVFVEDVNIVKKAQKPKRQGEKGAIIEMEAGLDISNVMIKCAKCGPVRIRMQQSGKEKSRICAKCGGIL